MNYSGHKKSNNFKKKVTSVLFARLITTIAGLLTSVIIARTLGPEKNGEIAALMVYPSIFLSFGTLGIRQSTTYFIGNNVFNTTEIKKSIAHIWLYNSLLGFSSCFLLLYFFHASSDGMLHLVLASSTVPVGLYLSYSSGIFLGKNKIGSNNKINWVPPLVTFAAVLITVLLLKQGIAGYLVALVIGYLVVFIILFIKQNTFSDLRSKMNREISKSLVRLGLVYALSLFIITLNYKFDIILLNHLSDKETTGIYAKGAGIANYLWQIPMIFSTIIFAGSATSKKDSAYSMKVFSLLRLTLLFAIVIALILALIAQPLTNLLFGDLFSESATIIRLLLPGVVVLILFKVLSMDLAGKGKPMISLKAMLPALLANIILNLLLIPHYGSEGAAIASTISYTLGGILYLYFYSKSTQFSLRQIISPVKNDIALLRSHLFNNQK